MEEVSGLKGDGLARYGNVVVVCWRVREVATYCECHRLVLGTQDRCSQQNINTNGCNSHL